MCGGVLLLFSVAQSRADVVGIGGNAQQQIAALEAEKATRTPAEIKMDSQLVYALKQSRGEPFAAGVTNLSLGVKVGTDGNVLVDMNATVSIGLLKTITQVGGTVQFSSAQFNSIRALVPLGQLESLAALPDVKFIKPAVQARARTGSVDSEGDTTHRAIDARASFFASGAGVKVGVLSDSVDFYTNSQATGDLPPNLTILSGQSGIPATGEGTAMLEIIHDLAPASQLYFATAFNGEASFAQNILNLRAAGCDIIVDDVGYVDESPFQDGIVAQAVNQVTASGALYFSAAGNDGNLDSGDSGTWEGDFVNGGPVSTPVNGKGGNVHLFGTNAFDTVLLPGGAAILLWSDPLGASTNDYDLFVLDPTGTTIISASTTVQNGIQDPFEIALVTSTNQLIVVVQATGEARFLHLDTLGGLLSLGTAGNITGHPTATNAYAVAAVDIHTAYPNPFTGGRANPVEYFSSDGPRRVFYNADGTPITPGNLSSTGGAVRQKPDITAADGVSTTVPGFAPFYGTSAAAPHAAAMAALLKSYNEALTPLQIKNLIDSTSLNIGPPGVDRDSGAGIMMAYQLLQAAPAGLNLQIATNYLPTGNGNGVVDPNECNDLFISITNLGGVGATNLQATIMTTTTGVTVTKPTSAYPDLPTGAGAINIQPFEFSTVASYVCGTPVSFALVIKCNQGVLTNYFSVASGETNRIFRFDNGTPVPIPDNNPIGASSPVIVSGITSVVQKVTVSLYLPHTFDSDLLLELVAPDGTTSILSANNGGAGQNYGTNCSPDSARTFFDDDATIPISAGFAPFTGTYRPDEPLAVFSGKSGTNVNGTWQLHVVDQAAIDVGTIECWSLNLYTSTCTDGGGQCPGVNLAVGMVGLPNPAYIGSNLVYTISVTNYGPNTAKSVIMNQTLPGSVVFLSGSASQGTVSFSGGVVSANLGNMSQSGVATVTVTVLPTTPGSITSTATVASLDTELDPSDNTATVTTAIKPPTSDLAVQISGAPNPALVGGTLSYTVSVNNNGPNAASGITVTNTLPAGVVILSAASSQGTATIAGNVVVFNFGTLANGGTDTGTISVIPTTQGTIVATATVSANQTDPVPGNNTATSSVTVTPAADLAVSISGVPASVVVRSNMTYVVTVTNLGPNQAAGIVLNDTLPPNTVVVTNFTTQGTLSRSNSTIICSLGALNAGASFSVTAVVAVTNTGTAIFNASVSGTQADPNFTNNAAASSTFVAAPFINILAAGSTLTSESFSPPDGAIEPGETVTVQFRLRNAGNIPNTNLVATLLATGGVSLPSVRQTYGVLLPGNFPTSEPFSFTAAGTNGGALVATFQLQDAVSNNLGTVSFNFTLSGVKSFANTNVIVIPDIGAGRPYPSTIAVSGVTGLVGKVTATLSNFNHTYPHDVSVLLVSPTGANTLLMSHVSDQGFVTGANLTFDDSAATPLPASGSIASGVWLPTAYSPAPVFFTNAPPATNPPAGPYPTAMSVFNSANPNGTWLLYVMDDSAGDAGGISNGWSLAFTTITPVNQLADLSLSAAGSPGPILVGSAFTNTFTIVNNGPAAAGSVAFTNMLPVNVAFVTAISSQGIWTVNGNTFVGNLGGMGAGASATVAIVLTPASPGSLTNSASVSASETDLNMANNTATVVSSVNLPSADVAVTQSGPTNPVVVGNNLTFTITITNNGPNNALNAMFSGSLPPGLGFISTSVGTNAGGLITASLGTLVPGAGTVIYITASALSAGTVTNVVAVTTSSGDANQANNSAATVVAIVNPSPNIVPAGDSLVSESFLPANGTVDPGETVTVSLALANTGSVDTTSNFTATLQNSGGVASLSSPQNYGVIVNGGASVARQFSFTAGGTNGGLVTATLQLQDGSNSLGSVAFIFNLPLTNTFANTASIVIPDHGAASPYPSTINVSGVTGYVSKATVTLNNLTHAFPSDIHVLLVGPGGQKVVLMSANGGGYSVTNVNLTFDDAASALLPASGQILSGTYKPTDGQPGTVFPSPAPSGSAGTSLSAFNGTVPNGTWSLYVLDSSPGDSGIIAGGWNLTLTIVNPVNPVANLSVSMTAAPNPAFVGGNLVYTINVANQGPANDAGVTLTDVLPPGVNFVSVVPAGTNVGGTVTCNLAGIASGAASTVTLTVSPSVAGALLNNASIVFPETDLTPADNSAQLLTTALNAPRPLLTGKSAAGNGAFQLTVTGLAGQPYVVQTSTNLVGWSSVFTNVVPSGGSFIFTDSISVYPARFYRALLAQ